MHNYKYEECIEKINKVAAGRFRFDQFIEQFEYWSKYIWDKVISDDDLVINGDTKVAIQCFSHHAPKMRTVSEIVDFGLGCEACEKKYEETLYRSPDSDTISRRVRRNGRAKLMGMRSIFMTEDMLFLAIKCDDCSHESNATYSDYFSRRWFCKKCGNKTRGFRPDKCGYLYALRSECGRYLKVGISNNPDARLKSLSARTPFAFNRVELIRFDNGKDALDNETRIHRNHESASLSGFDGCTEWLFCTPELLEELRAIGDK